MRIAFVFPPSLCLPNTLYFALPLLAGAARRAGHDVAIVDLNQRAADRFLTPERTRRFLEQARGHAALLRRGGRPDLASAVERTVESGCGLKRLPLKGAGQSFPSARQSSDAASRGVTLTSSTRCMAVSAPGASATSAVSVASETVSRAGTL